MEPLSISALLFTLVALEVSITVKKSTGEGSFAFLSPRIRSSRQQVLSTKLEELLKIKDHRTLQTVLSEAGILDRGEKNLNQLEKLELSIANDWGEHYDLMLHYLTEDLKEFFKAYKILEDVERLKMLLCYVYDEQHPEEEVARREGCEHLDLNSVKGLSEAHDLDEVLKNAMKLLPPEFSSRIRIEEDHTIQELLFSLDLAAFEYLRKKSEEIGTRRIQLTWDIVAGVYETENIITMGRLKYSNVPSKEIGRFLFPVRKRLEDADFTRLLEAEGYSNFLHILQSTPYNESIPQREITPMELEVFLKRWKRSLKLEEMLQEEAIDTVANFLIKLEEQYDIIREASFFVFLKEGGRKQT